MPEFLYTAKNRQGLKKEGALKAINKDVVTASLRRQGLIEIKVKKKPIEINIGGDPKVTEKDISIFFRQLSTMINAGLPLVQCFELLTKGTDHKGLLKLFKGIREKLENGCMAASISAP
jgi:type IV pilus assembly protein PilC